jgi:hypothetical protein
MGAREFEDALENQLIREVELPESIENGRI